MTKQELINRLKSEIILKYGSIKGFLDKNTFSLSTTSIRNAFSLNHARPPALIEIADKLGIKIKVEETFIISDDFQ